MDNSSAKKRLIYFLLLSCILHMILLYALGRYPFPEPEPLEENPLVVELIEPEEPKKPPADKKLKRYDMMEVKEALSEVPASLSKNREGSKEKIPQVQPVKPVPKKAEKKPEKKVVKKPPPKPVPAPLESLSPPLPGKDGSRKPKKQVAKKKRKPKRPDPKEKSKEVVIEKAEEAAPKELPRVRDLIPSINDIFAMKAPGGSLYQDPKIVQDGIGERQAKVMYDEYLAEFKSRVKLNWKVFDDPYMHASMTVLLITINKDGSLQSVEKLKSSGMPGHDTETLFAVRHSFPMRAPPEILLDEEGNLKIHFSFHFLVQNAAGTGGVGRRTPVRPGTGNPYGTDCTPPCFRW